MAIKACPSCGGENHENATACLRCNADISGVPLSGVPAAPMAPPPPMFRQSQQMVAEPQTNGMAVASLVLGIASLIFSIFTGLVGLVLGIISAVQISSSGGRQKGMGMAITGIILSVIFPIAMIFLIITPKLMGASRKAKDSTLMANVVILRSAIEMYQADCGSFPPTLAGLYTQPSGLAPGSWKGPYLNSQGGIGGGAIPRNPYVTTTVVTDHWTYNGANGKLTFPTPTGNDANGETYSGY